MDATDPLRELAYAVESIARSLDLAHGDVHKRIDRLSEYMLDLARDLQAVPVQTADRVERLLDRSAQRERDIAAARTPPHGTAVPTAILDERSERVLAARVAADVRAQVAQPADGLEVRVGKGTLAALALKVGVGLATGIGGVVIGFLASHC